jgi:mono/diheme cytochrome c family protein
MCIAAWLTLFSVGCSPQPAGFSPNQLLTFRVANQLDIDAKQAERQVQQALTDTFGTSNEPRWPSYLDDESETQGLVKFASLQRAAGPFGRDRNEVEYGLYRKHCTQCHGISGDGRGPAAALLNPYPRDFRRGTFKFKSTVHGSRPTRDDLIKTIEYGIVGTSMPAMHNLKRDRHYADDIQVLCDYVIYLSVRGEVERNLMLEHAGDVDFEKGESLYDPSLKESAPARWKKQDDLVRQVVVAVVKKWMSTSVLPLAPVTEKLDVRESESWSNETRDGFIASSRRGADIFRGNQAACSQCHGEAADGNGKLRDFDEWTKDWTIRSGIDPGNPSKWRPLKKLGLLKPVPAVPRNIAWGNFRNGDDPESIYRTIVSGIEGTPMPAAGLAPEVKNGLTQEQIWDLVHFCQAVGNDSFRDAALGVADGK